MKGLSRPHRVSKSPSSSALDYVGLRSPDARCGRCVPCCWRHPLRVFYLKYFYLSVFEFNVGLQHNPKEARRLSALQRPDLAAEADRPTASSAEPISYS